MNLFDVIGKQIEAVRYIYKNNNEYGLQEFHSTLKLSNNVIMDFPVYDDEVVVEASTENIQYFKKKGEELSDFGKEKIEGQTIEDFYFCTCDGEIDDLKRAYIKISNGIYITEINYAPIGVVADLLILNHQEFIQRTTSLSEKVISYLNQILTQKH